MKKVIILNASKVEYSPDPHSMHNRGYAEGEDLIVSDGYHTFDELYDHRITLYIALCKNRMYSQLLELAQNPYTPVKKIWRSKTHSDGTSWDGWFILGIGEKEGEQVTYHLPIAYWDDTEFAETLEKAPKWDGHTSSDVLNRLKNL